MKRKFLIVVLAVLVFSGTRLEAQAGYLANDFHQHTTYTDGMYSFGTLMEMNHRYGLDWWANSEHGGQFALNGSAMWRWESIKDWSFKDMLFWRGVYPKNTIIQGLEMNVPGHEHASVAILGNQFGSPFPDANAVAEFEYRFDANDGDGRDTMGWLKEGLLGDAKALAALHWLKENHPKDSWFIVNHPERFNGSWSIADVRKLNASAPDIFFGFTSVPGHQKYPYRGGYYSAQAYRGLGTFGGTGAMAAKVGGYWDALLSEDCRFWLFANSDCHNAEVSGMDFFPGEYLKNYTWVTDRRDPQAIVDGLRSGNTYVVMGDLIDSLFFDIDGARMGESSGGSDDSATISIRLHDPMGKNFNRYSPDTLPTLDHVDLIQGIVHRAINSSEVEANSCDSVLTTRILARFSRDGTEDTTGILKQKWLERPMGWKEIRFRVAAEVDKKYYYRLRGTNHPVNEPGETDAYGNPLEDAEGMNSAAVAFSDLWFYSNPVYVERRMNTSLPSSSLQAFGMIVDRNEKALVLTFPQSYSGYLTIYDCFGRCRKRSLVNECRMSRMELQGLQPGCYVVSTTNVRRKVMVGAL